MVYVRCPVTNIVGQRCTLSATHGARHDTQHAYADPQAERIAQLTIERDQARRDLVELRTTLAMDAHGSDGHAERKSSAFWYTMWTEARVAKLEIWLDGAGIETQERRR